MIPRVAVLGLGEAGSRYAADLLAAGVLVTGYDPAAGPGVTGPTEAGLTRAESPAGAVAGAGIVLSLTTAPAAVQVARDAAPGLGRQAVYADLSTGSPAGKQAVADALAAAVAHLDGLGVRTDLSRATLARLAALAREEQQ